MKMEVSILFLIETTGLPSRYMGFEVRGREYPMDLRERNDISVPLPNPGLQARRTILNHKSSQCSDRTQHRMSAQQILQ